MPERKRFEFFLAAAQYAAGAARAVRWQLASRLAGPESFVPRIRARAVKARMLRGGIEMLEKRYRAADFVLSRVLHVQRPSVGRSLAVYEYALRMGLYARLCVAQGGAEEPKGLVWVEVGGKPFMESAAAPSDGTVFFEG